MNLEQSKANLANTITNEYKSRIKALGLVSSGDTLRSIKAIVTTTDEIKISVESTDYFKYLDQEHGITDYVLKQPSVTKAMDELIEAMIIGDLS